MPEITFNTADYPHLRHTISDLYLRILKNPNLDEIKTCAKHLGLWHKKTVDVSSDTEVDLLMDYRVYAFQPNGFNMAEKYRRLHQNQLNDLERALLARMRLARYAVFQVAASNHLDTLTVTDVFLKTRITLVDLQMAKSADVGRVMAGHLIDLGTFCIQSGAALPLNKELLQDDEVMNAFDRIDEANFADYLLNPANTAKLARAIMAASIRLGHTRHVHYQSVD